MKKLKQIINTILEFIFSDENFGMTMTILMTLAIGGVVVGAINIERNKDIEREIYIKDNNCKVLEIDNVDRKIKYKCDDAIIWLEKR